MKLAALVLITYASFYSNYFNGRPTASGELLNTQRLTAAHPTLPFGTRVRVTNIANNKSVVVTITDRGPFVKGRGLDLTPLAFSQIANKNKGVVKVKVEVLTTSRDII